jgi:N-acetylneuraminate synthase/N,N'-diacetyllegionaminate synthase
MTWRGKHGPLLIAEIGGNHEGDFDYARRLVDLALASEADVVKLQVYGGDTLVSRVEDASRNAHFRRFALDPDRYLELAESITAAGKIFMASVWARDLIDVLDPHMPIYKIGSGDLTAYSLLREFARRGKPMIISTGLATAAEVDDAVAFVRSANPMYEGGSSLALLQCTSMYPTPAADANLAVMEELARRTGATVGYSDHTEGTRALEVACAMGAQVLEFHFTDTREGKSFRDHRISLTAAEVGALARSIREIAELRGSDQKTPLRVEGSHVVSFRRAVYPARDLDVGTVLTADDLTVLRPNHGIDARDFDRVVGRRLVTPVRAHQRLEWSMLADG